MDRRVPLGAHGRVHPGKLLAGSRDFEWVMLLVGYNLVFVPH